MLFNAIITLAGLVLFGVLLRTACRALFRSLSDTSKYVANANRLHFLEARASINSNTIDLDSICATLDHDYAALCTLLRHTVGTSVIEEWMLRAYFRANRIAFSLSRRSSRELALSALAEMSDTVACLANEIGERMIVRA